MDKIDERSFQDTNNHQATKDSDPWEMRNKASPLTAQLPAWRKCPAVAQGSGNPGRAWGKFWTKETDRADRKTKAAGICRTEFQKGESSRDGALEICRGCLFILSRGLLGTCVRKLPGAKEHTPEKMPDNSACAHAGLGVSPVPSSQTVKPHKSQGPG